MTPAINPFPITAQSLERAGVRLDLAESIFRAMVDPRPDGTVPELIEDEFGKAERELLEARRAYRALFELRTGLGWETAARRLGQ